MFSHSKLKQLLYLNKKAYLKNSVIMDPKSLIVKPLDSFFYFSKNFQAWTERTVLVLKNLTSQSFFLQKIVGAEKSLKISKVPDAVKVFTMHFGSFWKIPFFAASYVEKSYKIFDLWSSWAAEQRDIRMFSF